MTRRRRPTRAEELTYLEACEMARTTAVSLADTSFSKAHMAKTFATNLVPPDRLSPITPAIILFDAAFLAIHELRTKASDGTGGLEQAARLVQHLTILVHEEAARHFIDGPATPWPSTPPEFARQMVTVGIDLSPTDSTPSAGRGIPARGPRP